MMNIYNPDGTILMEDVVITSSAVHIQELMKSDYVKLSWSDTECAVLPVGAYIMPFQEGSVRYTLYSEYRPTSRNEVEYLYEPEFQHPKMQLAYVPCLFRTKSAYDSEKWLYETDWTYVGNLGGILGRLMDIIREQAGMEMTYVVTGDVAASATCSFAGVDILSAFSVIASAFEVEYHIDWEIRTVHFGKNLTLGMPVTLEEGANVGIATVNRSTEEAANCYIVRGGTRNITVQTASGSNVETDTRLTLEGYKEFDAESLIDTRESSDEPKLTKVLIFDNVYPKLDLYVYDVRVRIRRLLDDTGSPVVESVKADGSPVYKKYGIYYIRLAYNIDGRWYDYTIDPAKDLVSGKELMASFEPNEDGTHSALAGREFKMTYHTSGRTLPASTAMEDTGVEIKAGDYEINFEQSGDLIIPNINTLQPWGAGNAINGRGQIVIRDGDSETVLADTEVAENDKVVLYNLVMSPEYIASAQAELYEEAEKEIARLHSDLDNYTLPSDPVTFNESLSVVRAVTYKAVSGYKLDTRVIKIERSLDIPSDMKITVGNAEVKGNIQSLKEAAANKGITITNQKQRVSKC
ncbi:MAG: hypothetical protein NC116_09050 [Clostridium sp.]|nr:hypothetical protein [Bacteroidales bacterium]MCM1510847.1 hypothetical protein [Clostridium sp.]